MAGAHRLVALDAIQAAAQVGAAAGEGVEASGRIPVDEHGPCDRQALRQVSRQVRGLRFLAGPDVPKHGHQGAEQGNPRQQQECLPERLPPRRREGLVRRLPHPAPAALATSASTMVPAGQGLAPETQVAPVTSGREKKLRQFSEVTILLYG
jgi:hypothetical protein